MISIRTLRVEKLIERLRQVQWSARVAKSKTRGYHGRCREEVDVEYKQHLNC